LARLKRPLPASKIDFKSIHKKSSSPIRNRIL